MPGHGFTYGTSDGRRSDDGRHHFTITTGNTTAGPGLRPMHAEVRPPAHPALRTILVSLVTSWYAAVTSLRTTPSELYKTAITRLQACLARVAVMCVAE